MAETDTTALPSVNFTKPAIVPDFATILGLIFTFGFIATAIIIGQSNANFFNVPSLLIVLCGTMAATAVSYTPAEIARAGNIIAKSVMRPVQSPSSLASSLVDLAVVGKKKGILAISNYDYEMRKIPFLAKSVQMAVDGYAADAIERVLSNEIDVLEERHKRSASITRRASEVAPAMGLIGTLVGLVQMLAELENPEAIGPAMAIALLTTFYGAILGTIVMAPLAVKLEKNSADEALIMRLIAITSVSVASQENPRQLEMTLNSELPPSERIRYFD